MAVAEILLGTRHVYLRQATFESVLESLKILK